MQEAPSAAVLDACAAIEQSDSTTNDGVSKDGCFPQQQEFGWSTTSSVYADESTFAFISG